MRESSNVAACAQLIPAVTDCRMKGAKIYVFVVLPLYTAIVDFKSNKMCTLGTLI